MNPLQMMMQRAMMQNQQIGQDPMAPQTMDVNNLGALLGSVEGVDPMAPPAPPGVVAPAEGKALNPVFNQQIMQMMQQMNRPQTPIPSLGAILSGRA